MVAHLLRGEIHHSCKSPLRRQRFEGAAAHAGGVKHRDFKTSRLNRRFQRGHVAQHGLAKRGHADQGPVATPRLCRARGPQNCTGGLRQAGLADRVQPVQTPRPQDHLNIGGQTVGWDHRGKTDGGDDVFRHAQRQGSAQIQRQIGAHRATQHQNPVKLPVTMRLCRQHGGPARHDLHGDIFVMCRDGAGDGTARRRRHIMF